MPSADALDAVTIDAMGTLVELDAPVERLARALHDRGVSASAADVAAAFREEVEYYLAHKLSARDEEALADLRRECSRIFLAGVGADLDPADFTPAFVDSMVFEPLEGAVEALHRLRAAGLGLACVSDWDIGLRSALAASGLDHLVDLVLTSAEVGAAKPAPDLFDEAVSRLGVEASRVLHVGDDDADRLGAEAAGLAFAPVPLATIPDRLGVR